MSDTSLQSTVLPLIFASPYIINQEVQFGTFPKDEILILKADKNYSQKIVWTLKWVRFDDDKGKVQTVVSERSRGYTQYIPLGHMTRQPLSIK